MNYLECVKEAEKCSAEEIQKIFNRLPDSETKNNLSRLIKFINYSKTDSSKKFFNALEFVNINENSLTKLLAWLLDIDWLNNSQINLEESINYKFCVKFFELINKKSEEQQIKGRIDLKKAKCINSMCKKDYGDIFLITRNQDFICVIENKKLAKFSTDKKTNNIVQIERYYNNAKNNYPKSDKKFVYICALSDHMKSKKMKDHVNDPRHCIFQGKNIDPNLTIGEALKDCEYVSIEHSEVAMLLYEIIKEDYPEKINEFGIINSASHTEMLELVEQLNNMRNKSIAKSNTSKFFEKTKRNEWNKKLEKEIKLCRKNKEFFTNRQIIKEKLGLLIGARGDINFYYKLDPEKTDIIELLCRYVEYFELHCDVGDYYDNLPGYTKIVDGKYIYKVCCELSNDNEYENFPDEIKSLIENIKNIDEIIEMTK